MSRYLTDEELDAIRKRAPMYAGGDYVSLLAEVELLRYSLDIERANSLAMQAQVAMLDSHRARGGRMSAPVTYCICEDSWCRTHGCRRTLAQRYPPAHDGQNYGSAAVPIPTPSAPYGYCPRCGRPGVSRERRPDGNDRCEDGHTYPSRNARREEKPLHGGEREETP